MKPTVLEGIFDLPSAWFRVVQECSLHGYERPVIRGAADGHMRKELDFLYIEITNPSNKPLVPDLGDSGLPPPTSMDYVNEYVFYLMTPKKDDLEDYTYGERMAGPMKDVMADMLYPIRSIDKMEGDRVSGAILDFSKLSEDQQNQIGVIKTYLKESRGTNRSIITVGRASDLMLDHPPCLRVMQFKERYGQLDVFLYFRSWDLWGGFPSNLAAIEIMKSIIAGEIGVKSGAIVACSMGAHLYDWNWELAETVTTRQPKERTRE